MKNKILKVVAFAAVLWGLVAGCGNVKQIPVETKTVYNYVDSTVVVYVDSTIVVEVPKEVYRDYTGLLDTLKLETSVAEAYAVVDTTNMLLTGEMKNKDTVLERVVYLPSEEHIVYRDSLITKEVPVEVEVVKYKRDTFFWVLLGWAIASVLGIAVRIFIKIKTGK